ncbi:MAG: hypothetical protein CL578_07575 [Alteromonadaceae bacterium]|uniref:AraC family transcriptional regulator ligand-binding domain-containing protein n=1 Tax=Paraglaciecola chathamensis TaxID=368405 RepID=UPI000C678CFD|nr:AraC family transcriptional regulator ligand-binding domain-containing protein [Paraglaciecola agarilytica]MBN24892.1 hypothetical protein [Alteromonadaceae bacterium]|tara:strand:+ start:13846 stop:14256 length:411 start_codon:yes stop_codon:yes gene_type:complete
MNLHDVVSSIDVPMTNYNAISYSRGIARLMKLQEKDLHCLLRGTRLTVDRFIYDDIPISDSDQLQIFKNVLSTTNDPSFGLQLGAQLSPASHGSMGFLANSSPTLRGAIDDFTKFLPIRVSFGRLNLIPSETYTER